MIPKVILCATDFSEPSRRALDEAIDIAKRYGLSSLRLVNVGMPFERLVPEASTSAGFASEMAAMQEVEAVEIQKFAAEASRASGLTVIPEYRAGETAEEIVRFAREIGADMVVVGTHGRTGFKRLFLGSVAEHVVRAAPCTVVAVRAREEAK